MLTTLQIQELQEQGERWLNRKHRNLPRMDREEILQDSLIALAERVERRPYLDRVANLGGLLGTIIDRRATDNVRKDIRRNAVEQSVPDVSAVSTVAMQTHEDLIFAVTLDQTLRTLPRELRDVFILMDLRGLTSHEASTLLHTPASTIRNWRDEARNLLRKELQ